MFADRDVLPIIEPGSADGSFVGFETQRMDQVQNGGRARTHAGDGAGVLGNHGLVEDDI